MTMNTVASINTEPHQKTVYVLGAGFSIDAGGPLQSKLLEMMFKKNLNLLITKRQKNVKQFLKGVLNVVSSKEIHQMALEDLYTPIDRCLADGISFKEKGVSDLLELRRDLDHLVSVAIRSSFGSHQGGQEYVDKFAKHIVEIASKRRDKADLDDDGESARIHDYLSIVSLNWDVVLDNAIFNELKRVDREKLGPDEFEKKYARIGVVDYCCYISSVDKHDPRVKSGLWALGSKGYNVKLLKIHGSLNWLQCPHCQRLFTKFGDKPAVDNFEIPISCRHCKACDLNIKLQAALVMPTFLKDLRNFQIKLVWQNAAVELMEATKIVFIGYSLPHADFEFRQLLSRMVRKSAKIHVVLLRGSEENQQRAYNDAVWRYRQFFSGHEPTFDFDGVEAYVDELTAHSITEGNAL